MKPFALIFWTTLLVLLESKGFASLKKVALFAHRQKSDYLATIKLKGLSSCLAPQSIVLYGHSELGFFTIPQSQISRLEITFLPLSRVLPMSFYCETMGKRRLLGVSPPKKAVGPKPDHSLSLEGSGFHAPFFLTSFSYAIMEEDFTTPETPNNLAEVVILNRFGEKIWGYLPNTGLENLSLISDVQKMGERLLVLSGCQGEAFDLTYRYLSFELPCSKTPLASPLQFVTNDLGFLDIQMPKKVYLKTFQFWKKPQTYSGTKIFRIHFDPQSPASPVQITPSPHFRTYKEALLDFKDQRTPIMAAQVGSRVLLFQDKILYQRTPDTKKIAFPEKILAVSHLEDHDIYVLTGDPYKTVFRILDHTLKEKASFRLDGVSGIYSAKIALFDAPYLYFSLIGSDPRKFLDQRAGSDQLLEWNLLEQRVTTRLKSPQTFYSQTTRFFPFKNLPQISLKGGRFESI